MLESTALGAMPFVEEASRWLPEDNLELAVNDFNLGAMNGNAVLSDVPLGNALLENPPPPSQAIQPARAKILLADDNADMRDYVKRLLIPQFEITTVMNGAAALRSVQTNPPDLVLSDVMMPEMDGFELLRSLRANPATQEIPIILLSARAGEEARIEGLQAGADDYLTKPFSARELIARVEANLKLAQLRRETTQALQRSEERYRAFVQQSSEAIWRFEVEVPLSIHCSEAEQIQHFYAHSYLAECNQVMAKMYGVASVQELLGAKLSDLLVPSDPRNLEYLHNFICSGYRLVDAESYEVDQQGNSKIFLNNLIGIVEDEKLVRVWGTQRDITERKQAEVALQERKQRLDIATSAAGLGVFEWNVQTDHAIWENQRMYNIMGCSPEDGTLSKAQFVSNVIHPDDREAFEQSLSDGMKPGNACRIVCRIRRHNDQQWRWVELNGRFTLASDGTPLRLIGVVGDITDAKQAEAALRQSEAEFRQLANSMPQIVWVADAAGTTEFVNNRWIEYSGLDADQSRDPAMMQQIIPPEDLQQLQADFAQAQASSTIYQSQFRLIQPNSSYRYFLTRAIPIKDDQGQVQKWYGTSTDITELKQLEAERAKLLTQEQAAREAAEQANRIKDEFLAVLSHELRSPLNPILGWAKLLQQGQLDDTKTAIALATIERNAKLQAQLIDDLLDISRILRGKLRLEVTLVDLASVITAALDTVRLAAEAKSLHIQTALSPVDPVNGDAGRLQQVVWNLLSNAVKFTSEGGRVEVRLEQGGAGDRGDGTYATAHQYAQITVSDTGKGIKADFLPYVFEHFRQEDGATTRKFGGLGLGLAIVRQIVELHGGTVAVASPGEGQGATFTVQIPLALRCEQGLPPESALPSTGNLTNRQILLVDDEPDSREFVSFVLEEVGASVTSVASGIEALQKIEQLQFDLIISDIGMPEIDGYMLIQQIRALGYTLPAIALTAYASEYDQQQALAAGFQQHIAKPIDPEMLIHAVSALCHASSIP
jgi:PAS domain S-box-containing protein